MKSSQKKLAKKETKIAYRIKEDKLKHSGFSSYSIEPFEVYSQYDCDEYFFFSSPQKAKQKIKKNLKEDLSNCKYCIKDLAKEIERALEWGQELKEEKVELIHSLKQIESQINKYK